MKTLRCRHCGSEISFVGSLTAQERAVAGLIAEGYNNKRIAELLVLSEKTVEHHMNALYKKLSCVVEDAHNISRRTYVANLYRKESVWR